MRAAPGWLHRDVVVPRSFIGLPVIMIMPSVRSRGSPKSRKEDAVVLRDAFSLTVNFLVARDKKYSRSDGGYRRYLLSGQGPLWIREVVERRAVEKKERNKEHKREMTAIGVARSDNRISFKRRLTDEDKSGYDSSIIKV